MSSWQERDTDVYMVASSGTLRPLCLQGMPFFEGHKAKLRGNEWQPWPPRNSCPAHKAGGIEVSVSDWRKLSADVQLSLVSIQTGRRIGMMGLSVPLRWRSSWNMHHHHGGSGVAAGTARWQALVSGVGPSHAAFMVQILHTKWSHAIHSFPI